MNRQPPFIIFILMMSCIKAQVTLWLSGNLIQQVYKSKSPNYKALFFITEKL